MLIVRLLKNRLVPVRERVILVITGARQVGKTTLVKNHYSELPYYNLDAPEYREQLGKVSSFRWADDVGPAVLDEIQKQPGLFDVIKYSFDEGNIDFSVITGSSQILLMQKIRESMAGRVHILELFPLMLSELADPQDKIPGIPLFAKLLDHPASGFFPGNLPSVLLGPTWDDLIKKEEYLVKWGGMPALLHLNDNKRRASWLRDYSYTYLERDLADLARLPDHFAFAKFQRLAAQRCSNLLTYAEIAKDAGISNDSARRYLEYLRISYQTELIQPYQQNITSSTIRTPKIYWLDNGLMRYLGGFGFETETGFIYENYVAAEMIKWIRTNGSDARLYFYRTRSGMEIDFLVETETGILLIEVKNRAQVSRSDFSSVRQVAAALGSRLKLGLVAYRGNEIISFGERLYAIPSCRLFGEKISTSE